MDKKVFLTRIDATHKHGKNPYVLGFVAGMMHVLCVSDKHYAGAMVHGSEDRFLTTETTPENYEKFKEAVEERYPGLCQFNCGKLVRKETR